MLTARLQHWSAWAPDRSSPDDWRAWTATPTPLAGGARADAKFLPAMLRRRCTPLTRAMPDVVRHRVDVRLDDVRRPQIEIRIEDATVSNGLCCQAFAPTLRKLSGRGP